MKKKVLSLALALSLCLGLTVTASAAVPTTEEAFKTTTLEYADSTGKKFTPAEQTGDLWVADYDYGGEVLSLEHHTSYPAVPVNTRFTVTNNGFAKDCKLIIHAVAHKPTPKATVGELPLDADNGSDDLSQVTQDTVYLAETYWKGDFLDANGKWTAGKDNGIDTAVRLKAGESITFSLPASIKDGDICRLYVELEYPREPGDDLFLVWATYDIMMDNKAGTSAPVTPPVTPPAKPAFTDVAADAYYVDAVKWAVEQGVTSGTTATTFSPNNTCTTAQILTFLWRANGSPAPTGANPFTDVPADAYYTNAAVWAHEKGLVTGTVFDGSTPATRAATVTYLWMLAGKPSADPVKFDDVAQDAAYATAVGWAVSKGITTGVTAQQFVPDNICTRGQIVTFLYRGLAK